MISVFQDAIGKLCILQLLSSLAIASSIIISNYPACAQVVPDGTLGIERSIVDSSTVNGSLRQQIEGGAIRGNNLFHSFRDFSIPEGQSLYFQNLVGIKNIISRVTGSSPSTIEGTLGVSGGTANLFLLNPNGIIFGTNARLDVGGSFVATTAPAVQFGTQGFFSSSAPDSPPLLTVNPSALLFNQMAHAAIVNHSTVPLTSGGRGLQVPDGQSLLLLGGDVTLDGGGVNAAEGRVELGAFTGIGIVGLSLDDNLRLSYPATLNRANITLTNGATVDTSGEGGGSIQIWGGRVSINNGSQVAASTQGSKPGGNLTVDASESLEMIGFALFGNVFGNISTLSFGDGKAGDITINTRRLSVQDGAQIISGTLGNGAAGQLSVNAFESVEVAGQDSSIGSTGTPSFLGSFTGNAGRAGNLTIYTKRLIIRDKGVLSTESLIFKIVDDGQQQIITATGAGGNLTINASSLELIRQGRIFTNTRGSGNAGNITINTGRLLVQDGSSIGAQTEGSGNAGDIKITAKDTVSFDGVGSDGFPSAAFSSIESGASGQAGRITVKTNLLSVTNGGQLSVSSQGQEGAGNLDINVHQLRLDNQGSIQAQTASGQGGSISLQVPDLLLLRRGSFISTTAGTAQAGGDGGNIILNGNLIVAVPQENSTISANAFSGRGGNIRITTQGLFGIQPRTSTTTGLSSITASSEFGISGTIALNTPDVDPSRGTATLPSGVIDINALIASSCVARRSRQGRFVITGTGGLAPQPDDLANAAFPTYELVLQQPSQSTTSVTEADRIYHTSTGEIVLGRSCE